MAKPLQTASSIFFSLDLVSESRAFSPARGHFRVSRVSFDGLRKKRDVRSLPPTQAFLNACVGGQLIVSLLVSKSISSPCFQINFISTIETMIDQILILLLLFFFALKCALSGPKGKQDRRSNLTIKLSAHKRRSMWHARRGHSGVVTSQKSEKRRTRTRLT